MSMNSITVKAAAEFLRSHDDFLILSHANPDGDTMGSAYALCGTLQILGKRARIQCADRFSPRFDCLKAAANGKENLEFEAKTIVAVDVADPKLLGDLQSEYGERVELCIDHHISNLFYAKQTLVDPEAAAAAEVIYAIVKELKIELTDDIARCLYTAIATDTGCFKFSNTTPKTHIIAAELMKYNIGFEQLNYMLFDMKTKSRIKLEQQVMNSLEFYFEDRCAISVLTREMLDSVDVEDSNSLSSLPRQIEGVVVGVTIKEKEDGIWKASMRSVCGANVQKICRSLGGGGHIRAAGCTVNGTITEVKKQLLDAIGAEINNG